MPCRDTSASLEPSITMFQSRHPSPVEPTTADISFIRSLASYISRRSAAIVASSLFALWQFKNEAEADLLAASSHQGRPHFAAAAAREELALEDHVVAFNGSVIEQYPDYLQNCQDYIDGLLTSVGARPGAISLAAAKESSLLGAAVALACLEEGKAN
jgi:hexokinase